MTESKPEVVCLGIIVADIVGKPIDQWPERGKLVLVDRMETHVGGCAANTSIGLVRMGVAAACVGKVGHDGLGDFVVDVLRRNSVDTSRIVRSDTAATSATMVFVHSDGERSFLHCVGANGTLQVEEIDRDFCCQPKVLHVAGALLMPGFDGEPTSRILKAAKEAGVITCLDTAWDFTGKWLATLQPCLSHVDYFVPSIEEARMLTGRQEPADIARALLDYGIQVAALKMGEAGCYVRSADCELRIPSFVVDTVDATGAGDAFAAGFLAGLVKGWDLEQTGRLANAVGAACVTALGTTSGLRGFDETVEMMNTLPVRPL